MTSTELQKVSLQITSRSVATKIATEGEAEHVCLANRLSQLPGGHRTGSAESQGQAQVRDRSRRRREGYRAEQRHIVGHQGARSMDADTMALLASASPWDNHLD